MNPLTATDILVCTDCYEDGEHDEPTTPDREPYGLLDPNAVVTDNTCSNHSGTDDETCEDCGCGGYEDGVVDFSWSRCEGCGSTLGGARYRMALWPAV